MKASGIKEYCLIQSTTGFYSTTVNPQSNSSCGFSMSPLFNKFFGALSIHYFMFYSRVYLHSILQLKIVYDLRGITPW